MDVSPDSVKLRVLWSTREPRQHAMLASYDLVLTAIIEALDNAEHSRKENMNVGTEDQAPNRLRTAQSSRTKNVA